ncbi:MAG: nucleotidyltransferase domain-containing protein [Defluviitaleaceae bacterium]|nr:nucleotidyltransferase domain-containing protein [Defluviitaleaceae bacterium]
MVADFEAVRVLAEEYSQKAKQVLPVDKVILYGSYAKGTATQASDVDICFFLSDFNGKTRVDIIGELLSICGRYKGAYFEPNAFPTSEIARGNPFVDEILATGVEI